MTTKELRKEFCKKHDIPYTEFIDELFIILGIIVMKKSVN